MSIYNYLTFTFEYSSDPIILLENEYIMIAKRSQNYFNAKEIKYGELKLTEILHQYFTKMYEILIKINYLDADISYIREVLFDNLGRIKDECKGAFIARYHTLSGNYGGLSLNIELSQVTEQVVSKLFNEFIKYLMDQR